MLEFHTFNLSFEFFPPKTDESKMHLEKSALQLAEESPQFFSVTYGAGGSTRTGTLESVKMLRQKTTIPVAPHLACIGAQKEELLAILQEYKELGVRRIVALRGDMPSGMGHVGEMRYACDLVALIREAMGDYFYIEVAAYPESHPQSKHALEDILHFKKKVDAGANSAITQYFYNPDAYFFYRDYCAKLGIHIPIVPGIMPITNYERLQRFSSLCGAEIPQWIRSRLEAYGDDLVSLQSFGLEVLHHLCEKLLAGGAPGLHFYTLNHAETSIALLQQLHSKQTRNLRTIKNKTS